MIVKLQKLSSDIRADKLISHLSSKLLILFKVVSVVIGASYCRHSGKTVIVIPAKSDPKKTIGLVRGPFVLIKLPSDHAVGDWDFKRALEA